jgi:hypothetical protein
VEFEYLKYFAGFGRKLGFLCRDWVFAASDFCGGAALELSWRGRVMSDGREEREQREARIEEEKRKDREDRVERDDLDEGEPERVDS